MLVFTCLQCAKICARAPDHYDSCPWLKCLGTETSSDRRETGKCSDTFSHMVAEHGVGVNTALEDAVGSRRAAGRIIAGMERTETS